MNLTVKTDGSEATKGVAQNIGTRLRGGEVIELISDLGGGKTTFMQGLAKGAGSEDAVASPTFTVSKVYEAPGFEIHHFDFYRLQDPGLMVHELEDLVGDPSIVVAVEWGQDVQHVLPANKLTIHIEAYSESQRKITFEYPETLSYLIEGIA